MYKKIKTEISLYYEYLTKCLYFFKRSFLTLYKLKSHKYLIYYTKATRNILVISYLKNWSH